MSFFQRFQDVEETHIKQMKEYVNTYAEVLQNNHDLIGQVRFINQIVSVFFFIQGKMLGFMLTHI